MNQPTPCAENVSLRLPVPGSSAFVFVAIFWLVFACALPLYLLHESRRQARQDLQRLLTTAAPDQARVRAAFDRSTQNLDAAATGPCLLLACASLLLVNRMLTLQRRLDEVVKRPPPVPRYDARSR